ncbi:hypothetical protein CSA37_12805 [Candidatus Fermentibacteria bacterium]|nr:MAG: hypothetical protein CSA37_12805 [Candidatus Fermentibacteria bacterium]
MAGRTIQADVMNPSEEVVSAASSVLHEGGIVVYPSDTVYGLMAGSESKDAHSRIIHLKGYSEPRPFIHLVGSFEDAMERTTGKSNLQQWMEKYWPGPVTLLLPKGKEKIAIRIPADPLSRAVLSVSGLCLISTSANLKGEDDPLSTNDIPESILAGADLVIDGGTLTRRKPSMIIDISGPKPVRLR